MASAEQVLASGAEHEFRTTVHPQLHTEAGILALAQTLSNMGVRHCALRQFRATGCAEAGLRDVSVADFAGADLLARLAGLFETFTFRRE